MGSEPVVIEEATMQIVDVSALESITRGEVDMQVATAKRFPRSLSKFKKDALTMATVDEATAAACQYAVMKGGELRKGASIRLAEIVAVTWGNLRIASRILDEGQEFVTAEAVCWDMETNVHISATERRRITTKNGNRYGTDMIQTTCKAAAAIARRNVILSVVPRAHVNAILAECVRVGAGDAATMGARTAQWLAHLKTNGVEKSEVLKFFGVKSVEDLGLDELATIQGLVQGAKESETSLTDVFGSGVIPEPPKGRQKVKAKTEDKKPAETTAPAPQQPDAPAKDELPPAPDPGGQGGLGF